MGIIMVLNHIKDHLTGQTMSTLYFILSKWTRIPMDTLKNPVLMEAQ